MGVNKTDLGAAIKAAVDAYVATIPDPKGDNLDRVALLVAFADGILDGNLPWQPDYSQTDNTQTDYIKNKPSVVTQIQSDYTQTDNLQVDYIKNKPTILTPVQSDYTESDSGDLAFIKNKPTIVTPVQSDYTEADTGNLAHILNKPVIPAAQIQSDYTQASTGALDYIKNKPTIPAAQIQSDWTQTTVGALDYIKNKPTIPTIPTSHVEATSTSYRDIPTTATQLIFNTIVVDEDSEQTLAGLFTADVAGLYCYTLTGSNLTFGAGVGSTRFMLYKGTTRQTDVYIHHEGTTSSYHAVNISTIIELSVGDTLSLKALKSASTFTSRWQPSTVRLSITQIR